MNTDSNDLDGCVARLAAGDRTVFSVVFEALWGPIYRMCLSLLKNPADASDAAQETLHKVFERAADYDRSRPAMPWAMAIAGWECRTILRRRSRRRETGDVPDEGSGESQETELLQRNLVSAAMAALGELSELDRETLVATFWDEAASVSGATLRKRRERAVDRLRQAYWRLYGRD
jgi:RNA polymerase sigma-70 factor (ECF subfamily)